MDNTEQQLVYLEGKILGLGLLSTTVIIRIVQLLSLPSIEAAHVFVNELADSFDRGLSILEASGLNEPMRVGASEVFDEVREGILAHFVKQFGDLPKQS